MHPTPCSIAPHTTAANECSARSSGTQCGIVRIGVARDRSLVWQPRLWSTSTHYVDARRSSQSSRAHAPRQSSSQSVSNVPVNPTFPSIHHDAYRFALGRTQYVLRNAKFTFEKKVASGCVRLAPRSSAKCQHHPRSGIIPGPNCIKTQGRCDGILACGGFYSNPDHSYSGHCESDPHPDYSHGAQQSWYCQRHLDRLEGKRKPTSRRRWRGVEHV
jgi:hypothetical protein